MDEELSTNKNVKKTRGVPFKIGNPGGGRPPGQKNYSTLYRQALLKIATEESKTPYELEMELVQIGFERAKKGDYKFYADVMDRAYGKPINRNENLNMNKDMDRLPEEDKERLRDLLNGEGT